MRFAPKKFAQRRPDGNGGWSWKLGKVQRTLYRLPALLEAVANEQPVFIAEGEKAVDALAKLGVPATCSPHGAGKWRDAYSAHLKDAKVIILPDADDPGRHHAEQVAKSLRGVASSVKVLALPGLPEGGDVYDWLSTGGGTAEKLWTLVEALGANGPAPKADQRKTNGPAQSDYSPEDDARPPAFTDEALALRFAEKHADRLRYVAGWNKWHIWTGHTGVKTTRSTLLMTLARFAGLHPPSATRTKSKKPLRARRLSRRFTASRAPIAALLQRSSSGTPMIGY